MSLREEQFSKALLPIVFKYILFSISVRDLHPKKASSPISTNLKAFLMSTYLRLPQFLKARLPIVFKLRGIWILLREVQSEKAAFSIVSNMLPPAIMLLPAISTVASSLQSANASRSMCFTLAGITTFLIVKPAKAFSPINL